jgi:hypothetical protein
MKPVFLKKFLFLNWLFKNSVSIENDRMFSECGAIGGMRIGRGNRSTRRKLAAVTTLYTTNPIQFDLGSNRGRCGGKPATNHLSYGIAFVMLQSMNWKGRGIISGSGLR